jgi:hypothetical protein
MIIGAIMRKYRRRVITNSSEHLVKSAIEAPNLGQLRLVGAIAGSWNSIPWVS